MAENIRENQITTLCRVLKTDMVYEASDGLLTAFFDTVSLSPLMQSDQLRRVLREGAQAREAPFLHCDAHESYYAGMRAEDGFLYMGPMCHQKMTAVKRARMYSSYGISGKDTPTLPTLTLPEIRDRVLLTASVLGGTSPGQEELPQLTQMLAQDEQDLKKEQTGFVLREEEEDDNASFRHSYHEEQLLMQAIRDGLPEEAVRLAESMDRDSGQLSGDYMRHRRNLAIIGIALCARAAIDGGLTPETAYRLSGYYIQKCDAAENPAGMLQQRNQAIRDMAERVRQRKSKSASSSYAERCRDYIRKHYREKIYLDEIAEQLRLSPTYLSRLFKKETGESIPDYLNRVRIDRAANLLLYSELSLPEIAQYVGYPNQSYFGKIFRQYRNMTPRVYQDRYRSTEYNQ